MHIHVSSSEGEAKFWIEPTVALCENYGLSSRALNDLQKVVEGRKDEVIRAWKKHFSR